MLPASSLPYTEGKSNKGYRSTTNLKSESGGSDPWGESLGVQAGYAHDNRRSADAILLQKPSTPDTLARKVRNVLDAR